MSWQRLAIRVGAGAVLLVVVLLILGAITELVLERRDAHRFPPPGRLVDVGGRALHIRCAGSGSPTLVLEMGAGTSSLVWETVYRDLSRVTHVCAYDRAGYGWSDAGPMPRTGDALVSDLHALLRASGEHGPFVLAGHSFGGWVIRLYRARHPENVVGIALVDAAHPRQWRELPPEIWSMTRSVAGTMGWMATAGRFGLLRLMVDRLATQRLPDSVMPAYRATVIRPSAIASFASEVANSERIAERVEKLDDLDDLPLAVVTAGRSFDAFRAVAPDWPFEEAQRTWMRLQAEFLGLSTRSRQYVSPESTHDIQTDDPGLVVTALTDLVEVVRADRR